MGIAGGSAVCFADGIASQKWVEQRVAATEDEKDTYPLRLTSNKLHIALRRTLELGAQGMVYAVWMAVRASSRRRGQAASIGRCGHGFSVR